MRYAMMSSLEFTSPAAASASSSASAFRYQGASTPARQEIIGEIDLQRRRPMLWLHLKSMGEIVFQLIWNAVAEAQRDGDD